MTLYTHVDSNIRKTWLLMTTFLVLIIALGWLFSYIFESQIILIMAVIFSVSVSFLSYWYSDKIVLSLSRAHLIQKEDNPELYRLVENLSITAGLAMPKIYIIDEMAPNAFATGRNQKQAVIAVTQGLLQKLEKSELEGVLAHELAHIGNRDMLLQTIVVTLVGLITMLCHFFVRLSFYGRIGSRSNERQSGNLMIIFGIIAIILAPILAKLLSLAVSRKREFLADASGTLLTRYPEGLARALEKIAVDQTPLRIANNATAHLFIASPFKGKQSVSWLTKLFSTHPSLEERVKALRQMNI